MHSIASFVVFSCLCLVLSLAADPTDYFPVSLRTYAKRDLSYSSADYPRLSNNPGKWQAAIARKMKDDFFQSKVAAKNVLVNINNVNRGLTRKQLTDTKIDFGKQTYTVDNSDQANFVNDKYCTAAFVGKSETFTFDNRESVKIKYDDTMESTIKNDGLNAIRQGLSLLNKHGIQPRAGSGIPITIELAKWKNDYAINVAGKLANGPLRMADNEAFHLQTPAGQAEAKIMHTPTFLYLKKGAFTDSDGDPAGETVGDRVLLKFVKTAFTIQKWCTNLRILRAKYTVVHEMMHVLHRINSGDLFWEIRPFSIFNFVDGNQPLVLTKQVSEYAQKRSAPVLEVFAEIGTWLVARLNGDLDRDLDAHFKQAWVEFGGNSVKAFPASFRALLQVDEAEISKAQSKTSVPFEEKWQTVYNRGCSAAQPAFVEDTPNNKMKVLLKNRKNALNPVN